MTPDISCSSLIQIGLQISRWRTKWGPCKVWLYLKRLYFISSGIAYCISPYARFYAGLSCFLEAAIWVAHGAVKLMLIKLIFLFRWRQQQQQQLQQQQGCDLVYTWLLSKSLMCTLDKNKRRKKQTSDFNRAYQLHINSTSYNNLTSIFLIVHFTD